MPTLVAPTIPPDLAPLTNDELATLEDELVAYFTDRAANAATPEDSVELLAVTETIETVREIRGERSAQIAGVQAQVAEMAARLTPPPTAEGGTESDPPEEGEPVAPTPENPPNQPEETPTPPAETPPTAPPEAPTGTPANPTPPANPDTGEAPPPTARVASTVPARMTLAEIAARTPAHLRPRPEAPEGQVVITASADVPGFSAGQQIHNIDDLVRAIIARHHTLGAGRGGPDDQVAVARFTLSYPEERTFNSQDPLSATTRKLERFKLPDAPPLTAAGGLCAPTAGYYDQMVVAEGGTPVINSLANFGADRGGIRFNPPPRLTQITSGVGTVTAAQDAGQGGVFTDAVTNSTTLITSATAAFTFSDVGRPISGAGIPANTTIASVTSATNAVMSQAATASASGVTITIVRSFKSTFTVTCPGIVEVIIQSIFTSVQFGVLLQRTFPEQVAAWTQLLAALTDRTRETVALDSIAANSTAVTSAGLVGGGREVIARTGQALTGYRSRNRMDDAAPLDILLPAWVPDMMAADFTRSPATDPQIIALQRSQAEAWFRGLNGRVTWYRDSKTGGNQIFAAQSAGVLNQFPATAYAYVFAPGSFLHLDGGTLDIGLIRDSALIERNNVRMFTETFENYAFVGVESLEIAMALQPTGAAANGVTVASPIVS